MSTFETPNSDGGGWVTQDGHTHEDPDDVGQLGTTCELECHPKDETCDRLID